MEIVFHKCQEGCRNSSVSFMIYVKKIFIQTILSGKVICVVLT